MKKEDLIAIEKTVIPPIKQGTEDHPIYTTRGLVYWDKTTGLYYGHVEAPGSSSYTGPFRHSTDIPKSHITPVMDLTDK